MTPEENLDPEDWDEARRVGHLMIDDMLDYLKTVRERPAWRSVPDETKAALDEPAPMDGAPLSDVYETFKNHVLPYPTGNLHPGFFGWVMGNGTVTGMLADMLASGMNPHVGGYDQAAALIERQVIAWFAELLGYPKGASGLLVSGATMANINGLAVARNAKAGFDIRARGLQHEGAPRLRIYGSAETHNWILKACELMGLGRDAYRAVPVNADYEIDVAVCRTMIAEDIKNGDKPFCLLGSAGTVNTGAIDDLGALRMLADEFDLWFHIDGAFGSLAALSPQARPLVEAQSLADSIAFDLHKWGYMPYDVGCILVRDTGVHEAAFKQTPAYLTSTSRGLSVETTYFADKGVQLSRSFRALKVWMSLKEQGAEKLGRLIQQNIDQAKYLEALIRDNAEIELLAPVSLNIVCFRFRDRNANDVDWNLVNEEVLLRIQESGSAVPSQTILNSNFAIRVAITNHRTRTEDLDQLAEDVVRHGREVFGEG